MEQLAQLLISLIWGYIIGSAIGAVLIAFIFWRVWKNITK